MFPIIRIALYIYEKSRVSIIFEENVRYVSKINVNTLTKDLNKNLNKISKEMNGIFWKMCTLKYIMWDYNNIYIIG